MKYIPEKSNLMSLDSNPSYGLSSNPPIAYFDAQSKQILDTDPEQLAKYLENVKSKTEPFDWRRVKNSLVDVCENETGSFKVQEIFNSGA